MQSEFYRDLVTPVSPTNEFSFLNFLRHQGRLNRFISAGFLLIDRSEFEEYLQWVSAKIIPDPKGDCTRIDHDDYRGVFLVNTKTETYELDSVSIGTGREPYFPPGISPSKHLDASKNLPISAAS
jgi:lysine N6-hydroxylase